MWGGKAQVKATLYMGALATTCYDPVIQVFYQRLLAAGKVKKVALAACMRKLLLILNAMAKTSQAWPSPSQDDCKVIPQPNHGEPAEPSAAWTGFLR